MEISILSKLDYSICKDITAETLPTGRTYFTPNGDFPSVTTILGATADNSWKQRWKDSLIKKLGSEEAAIDEMAAISKYATDRGEKVHSYLERHWNGEDVFPELTNDTQYKDIKGMTSRLITATEKNITKCYAQELAVWSKELRYAGRVDMIADWRGEIAIIDFKTSKKHKYQNQIKDYYIQCSAYAKAFNEMFGTNIEKLVILITVENDKVQGFYGNSIHYIPELKYRINQYKRINIG